MFLLSRDKDQNERTIRELVDALPIVPRRGPASRRCGSYWLTWHPSKSWERLEEFSDGFLIGGGDGTAFQKVGSGARQTRPLPSDVHPLATGVKIAVEADAVLVEPLNCTNVFCGMGVVSDMQLLIARMSRTLPSSQRVAVLAGVGYLPGNLTLFDGIDRIPYLHAYDLTRRTTIKRCDYPRDAVSNDFSLIERLVEIVPEHPRHYLGMSGGYDSRFVLGVLLAAGVRPALVHRVDVETPIVRAVAKQLDLELVLIDDDPSLLPADVYTVASDAQIYFRGGNYSTLRTHIGPDSLYHTGLFADAVIKNAFKTAAKLPGGIEGVHDRLVNHALLSTMPGELRGLQSFTRRTEVAEYLIEELRFGRDYHEFSTKKEWANWYYFLHRGIRWTQATTADLSYFTQPVFILSDLIALSHGISSSMWDNFKKDRVRRLCDQLLPDLNVPFADGKRTSTNRLVNSLEKIKYEYLERLMVNRRGRSRLRGARPYSRSDRPVFTEPADSYSTYFSEEIERLLSASGRSRSLKRCAVTLHYALQLIERGTTTYAQEPSLQEPAPA